MALAHIAGGEGHFGQPHVRGSSTTGTTSVGDDDCENMLAISSREAAQFVPLFADALHQRAKNGPGGYSAATFTIKGVLHVIRCLLTSTANQIFFAGSGVFLNSLLLKALAKHAILGDRTVDDEAAEHACFSLYLQSNLGFKVCASKLVL